VVGWVVDKWHSIVEYNNGYTSTPTFTSPSKDQHSYGLHVIKEKNVKKVWQPNMYIDLETLGLKQLQATTTNCNMAFAIEM